MDEKLKQITVSQHTIHVLGEISLQNNASQAAALQMLLTTQYMRRTPDAPPVVAPAVPNALRTTIMGAPVYAATMARMLGILPPKAGASIVTAVIETLTHNLIGIEEDRYGIASILNEANTHTSD